MRPDFRTDDSDQNAIAVMQEDFTEKSERAWGHCDAVMNLTPLNSDRDTGDFLSQSWFAGDCLFSQRAIDCNSHEHDRNHIQETGDVVFIYRYLSGTYFGNAEETPYTIHPGHIAFSDYSRPFNGIQTACVSQGVFFPHSVLNYLPGESPRIRLLSHRSPFAQLIHTEFDCLFELLQQGKTELPADRLDRLKNVLRLVLQGKSASEDTRMRARHALKRAICEFIERNLANPQFSPQTILKSFGVSRATLFRMFEIDGGVRTYTSHRRLFRAVHQISTDPLTRGEISKAASDWGFSSDANFNRSVRRVFGTSPNNLFGHPITEIKLPPPSRSLWKIQRDRLLAHGLRATGLYARPEPYLTQAPGALVR